MVLSGPSSEEPLPQDTNAVNNNFKKELSSFSSSNRRINRPHPVLETIQESDIATCSTSIATATVNNCSSATSHNSNKYYDLPPLSASSSCSSSSTLASPSFGNFRVSHSEPLLLHYSPEDALYSDIHRPQVSRRLSFSSIDKSRRSITSLKNNNNNYKQQQILVKHHPSSSLPQEDITSLQSPGLPINFTQHLNSSNQANVTRNNNSSANAKTNANMSSPVLTHANLPLTTSTTTNSVLAPTSNSVAHQPWSKGRHAYTDSRDSALEAFFFPFKYDFDPERTSNSNSNNNRQDASAQHCKSDSKETTFSETHSNEKNYNNNNDNANDIMSPFSTPSPNSYYSPGKDTADTDTGTDLDSAGICFSPQNFSISKSLSSSTPVDLHNHNIKSATVPVQMDVSNNYNTTKSVIASSSSPTATATATVSVLASTSKSPLSSSVMKKPTIISTIDSPFRTSSDTGYSTLESNGPLTPTRPNSPACAIQNNLDSNIFACEPLFTSTKRSSDTDSSSSTQDKDILIDKRHVHHLNFTKWRNRGSVSSISSCTSLSYQSLESVSNPSCRANAAFVSTTSLSNDPYRKQGLQEPVFGCDNDNNDAKDGKIEKEEDSSRGESDNTDNDNDIDIDSITSSDSVLDDDLDGLPSDCSLSVFPLPPNTKIPLRQISSPTLSSLNNSNDSDGDSDSDDEIRMAETSQDLDVDRTICQNFSHDITTTRLTDDDGNASEENQNSNTNQQETQEPEQEQEQEQDINQEHQQSDMSALPINDNDKENKISALYGTINIGNNGSCNANSNGGSNGDDDHDSDDQEKDNQNKKDDEIGVRIASPTQDDKPNNKQSQGSSFNRSSLRELTLANRLSSTGSGHYSRAKSRLRSSFLFSSSRPAFSSNDDKMGPLPKSSSDSKISPPALTEDQEEDKLNAFLAPPRPYQQGYNYQRRQSTGPGESNKDPMFRSGVEPSRLPLGLPLSAPLVPSQESKWPTDTSTTMGNNGINSKGANHIKNNDSLSSSSNSSLSTATRRPDSRRSSQIYLDKGHGPLGRVVPGSQSLFYTQSHSVASASSLPLHSSTPSPKYYQHHFSGHHSTSKLVGGSISSSSFSSSSDNLGRSRSPEILLTHYNNSQSSPSPTFRNLSPSFLYHPQHHQHQLYHYQDTPSKQSTSTLKKVNGSKLGSYSNSQQQQQQQQQQFGTPQQSEHQQGFDAIFLSSPARSVDSYHTAMQSSTASVGTPNIQDLEERNGNEEEEEEALDQKEGQQEEVEWIQYGYAM